MAIRKIVPEHAFDDRREMIGKVSDHFVICFDVGERASFDGLLPNGEHGNRSMGCHGHPFDGEVTPCFQCFIVGLMPTGALFLGEDVFNRHSSIARA